MAGPVSVNPHSVRESHSAMETEKKRKASWREKQEVERPEDGRRITHHDRL